MRKQVRTIMCGCGQCQFRKNASDTCPQGTSKDAIQLWASDFSTEDPVSEVDDILEDLAAVREEIEGEYHECH